MRSQSYSFRPCSSRGVSHHHLHLVVIQRWAEMWESFLAEKGKAPDLPCVLVIGCWHGTAVGGLTRSGASCVIG